ncbi:MAG: hypothetical protein ABL993_11675 [Vicinamibacterales bacterium]
MALSDLFNRKRKGDGDADAGPIDAPGHPTKALPKFLSCLANRSQPVLLDLGPVVGSNVTFLGEHLGCKIFVENLFKDIDRHVFEEKIGELPAFFEKRFPQDDASVDGILCWDVFDYLDLRTAYVLAHQLSRILRPGGALLAQFQAAAVQKPGPPTYTRYVVVDPATLQYRPYAAARGQQKVLPNRDIQRMFEPLQVTEQFLLKTNIREVLFRKTASTVAAPPTSAARPE